MDTEKYERSELEIFEFHTEDVIMTSTLEPEAGADELPIRGTR